MIDYQGVITFESFLSTVVNEELSNALAIWRNLWDDGMDLDGKRRSGRCHAQDLSLTYCRGTQDVHCEPPGADGTPALPEKDP